MRYLGHPLRPLIPSDLDGTLPIALVDTQPGAGNNILPKDVPVAILLDHHPLQETSSAVRFADVRPEIGALSTLLTGYLRAAGIELEPPLATALFYGIKTDTMGLARAANSEDIEAYFYLQPLIEVEALAEIENAQVGREYFAKLVDALQGARVYDGIVISYLGEMDRPDMAAEMADLLLRLIRYIVVDTHDWLPGKKVLVSPSWARAVTWPERNIYVGLSREMVKNSPEFDPSAPVNREYELRLYDYYGRPKYWTTV